MNFLKGIEKAETSKSSRYIKPGKYLWEVQNILGVQGNNGTFFIAELICREAMATGEVGRDGQPIPPNAVGSTASFMVNLSDPKNKSAMGNIKDFLAQLDGCAESEITDETACAMLSDKEKGVVTPFRGALIRDEAFNKPTKKDPNKDFTHHRWQHVPQTPEEIKARRAELDKNYPLP